MKPFTRCALSRLRKSGVSHSLTIGSVSTEAIFPPELLSDLNCIGFFVPRQSVYQARLCGPAAACNECMAKIPKWRQWFVKGGGVEGVG